MWYLLPMSWLSGCEGCGRVLANRHAKLPPADEAMGSTSHF
jgi:hypothetical protein